MSTQPIENSTDFIHISREEYIRQARESCLRNYYGDRIPSRELVVEEYTRKRSKQDTGIELQPAFYSNISTIIPYDEERFIQGKNRKHSERGDKLDANIINQRLFQEKQGTINKQEFNIQSEQKWDTYEFESANRNDANDELLEYLPVIEPDEKNIPTTGDIMHMSGIEDETSLSENKVENENFKRMESNNYMTSIQNAELEVESEQKKKQSQEVKSFRFFAVRCVVAFLLLAAIIFLDKSAYEYRGITANRVYEKMVSSELATQIEEWLHLTMKP